MDFLPKILIAIILLAIIAVIVSQSSASVQLIQSLSSAFNSLAGAVVAPIQKGSN